MSDISKNKSPINVATIIIARNEENFIKKTLESLYTQTMPSCRIIFVNDGSTDNTREIASKFSPIEIIDHPPHESYLSKKELAHTINSGLEKISNDKNIKYVMILGSDHILPDNYLEEITKRMHKSSITIASGIIDGENITTVRGSGRVVNVNFWRKLSFRYPVNYGFESYLLLKAQSMGEQIMLYSDMITYTQRKTGYSYSSKSYYHYGQAMRILGYSIPYALLRIILLFSHNPKNAFNLFRGFISRCADSYESDVRKFVKNQQYEKLRMKIIKNIHRLKTH